MQTWDMRTFAFGTVALVTRDDLLCRVCFTANPEQAVQAVQTHCPEARRGASSLCEEIFAQLEEYFRGQRRAFAVKRDEAGLSAFARSVHRALLEVPYGAVVSYGELAARAGSPGAARAVGRVMSANPFPLLVPCHRVVNADCSPGRYSGGFGSLTKLRLLDLEGGR